MNSKANKLLFHHVCLEVKSIEKSINFYRNLFGFTVNQKYGPKSNCEIAHLSQANNYFCLELISNQKLSKSDLNRFHLAFHVKNFEKFLKTLREIKIKFMKGPISINDEMIVFIKDPDGYIIEINNNLIKRS